eukprot:CAMPEP_0184655314 /NCGR_PEP_ID=MMETSP0308-20130426/12928_1 /TAXON_ID=38269 /ORGANISM="Gloeochaete witrockiana, Strain SAG 46.84" /LENGTH=91 /DNA_ID=CAMNT_0027091715 /DNA_START=121 /DNA_END=396 /DNA_ORIENTATION=-
MQSAGKGIMKAVKVSPTLAEFVGQPEISRADTMKKIWEYIKQHNLQDPNNRRDVLADDKLSKVFGGAQKVSMFQIMKMLSPHFPKKEQVNK